MNWSKRLYNLHHFLAGHSLYPLILSSLLACLFLFGRVYASKSLAHVFLAWNLFLAWIPYLLSLGMASSFKRSPRLGWMYVIPSLLWLLFFPNAPYLITDLRHLEELEQIPLWYDIGMFATFGWTGIFLGVASLQTLQGIIRRAAGSPASWIFVVVTIGLSGFGIYLGRFQGWNSWDLLFRPNTLLGEVIAQLAHPIRHPQPYAVAFMFASFLFVCYLTFAATHEKTSI